MRRILLTCLVLLTLAAGAPSYAQDSDYLVAQRNGPTLDQAVEQVRRQYNGRIVSAETKRSGDREVHHIKVLTQDGTVKTVRIQGRRLTSRG